jgi:hypothetical protein
MQPRFHSLFGAMLLSLAIVSMPMKVHAEDCSPSVLSEVVYSFGPGSCLITPTLSQVLASGNGCPVNNLVLQAYVNSNWVSSPSFAYASLNQTIQFRVLHQPTGNAAYGVFKFRDVQLPVLTCPPNATVNCETSCNLAYTPTYSDCDPTLITSTSDNTTIFSCSSTLRNIERTFSAIDDAGNLGTCKMTISIASRPISQVVFPPHVTLQVLGTDCSPWCDAAPGRPAPSTSAVPLLYMPGVPTMLGKPLAQVQNNNNGCNGECVPDCNIAVSYTDAVVTICGTNRRIDRTWTVSRCSTTSTFIQRIRIFTDGNTNCGQLCYRPTSLSHSFVAAGQVRFNWVASLGCPVRYKVYYRFKVNGVWNAAWTISYTTTNYLNVSIPFGATDAQYYLVTECNGTNSTVTSTYSCVLPNFTGNIADWDNGDKGGGNGLAQTDMEAWPNPTTGLLNMDLGEALLEEGRIRVLALGGTLISEQVIPVGTRQFELDLSNQVAGIYVCEVLLDGRVVTKKVVVQ